MLSLVPMREERVPERPRVMMSVGASADGKVTLTRQQTLMQQPSGRLWAEATRAWADPLQPDVLEFARQHHGCTATLEGSGSLVPETLPPAPLPRCGIDPAELYDHFLPAEVLGRPSPPRMWFTAVDGRGRVRWSEEHDGWDVLVLVCRSTRPTIWAISEPRASATWWPATITWIWLMR